MTSCDCQDLIRYLRQKFLNSPVSGLLSLALNIPGSKFGFTIGTPLPYSLTITSVALFYEPLRLIQNSPRSTQYHICYLSYNMILFTTYSKQCISLSTDTRETGFVNAITAAGVTYSITRACTAGSLLECSCEKV